MDTGKNIKETDIGSIDNLNNIDNIDNIDNPDNTKPTKKSFKENILEWIKTIFIAFLSAYIITNYIIVNALIPTSSMVNTLIPQDRIVASRLSYIFSEPERGDIIIFRFPDDESILYVKRIIGLPGDTVTVVDGKVYLNDDTTPLDEPYLPEMMLGSYGPYVVPEDSYFAMGDNRNNSSDSRAWQNTFVHEDKILGKAIFKYYPKLEMLLD